MGRYGLEVIRGHWSVNVFMLCGNGCESNHGLGFNIIGVTFDRFKTKKYLGYQIYIHPRTLNTAEYTQSTSENYH